MQGRLTLVVDDVGVGALPHEQAEDVPDLAPDGQVDTGVAPLVRSVSGGASGHQGLDSVQVTSLHRVTEGSEAPAVLKIEEANFMRRTFAANVSYFVSGIQQGKTRTVSDPYLTVHMGAAVKELVDSSAVAPGGGKVERGPGPAVLTVHINLLEMLDNLVQLAFGSSRVKLCAVGVNNALVLLIETPG